MIVIAVLKKKEKKKGKSVNRRESLDARDMFFFLRQIERNVSCKFPIKHIISQTMNFYAIYFFGEKELRIKNQILEINQVVPLNNKIVPFSSSKQTHNFFLPCNQSYQTSEKLIKVDAYCQTLIIHCYLLPTFVLETKKKKKTP